MSGASLRATAEPCLDQPGDLIDNGIDRLRLGIDDRVRPLVKCPALGGQLLQPVSQTLRGTGSRHRKQRATSRRFGQPGGCGPGGYSKV